MYIKILIFLLLLEMIDITSAASLQGNKLIQNICETLHNNNSFHQDEDQQWEIICQELFHLNENDQYIRKRRNTINEEDIPPNQLLRKAGGRGGSSSRGGGIIRGGSGGGTIRGGGGSGSIPSIARYRNTRTGASIPRPNGWQWSRSRLIFLPIATRFLHRSRSSSNRYTTPSTSSLTYYYCTSDSDPSEEIQCSSANGDSQCCEDEKTEQVFCCGGDIPDDISQDMNRATRTIARIFYTLAVLAFCTHLFMRRFCR